ncbi:MAG: phenylalanine--tRNA ligase subunit beta [Firmicutes bacterium]|nr:phenylalanine--tRNA ligase subunit beta [Bacillota bacterium]
MRISLNWIKDYVSLPKNLSAEKIAHDLTMSCVEVEGWEDTGKGFNNIVLGTIKEVEKHPNADKLRVCKVSLGIDGIKTIVCGGTNVAPNMKVIVAKPGSFVKWHGEGDLIELKEADLRGIKSFGMICASAEIGLADLLPCGQTEIADITNIIGKDKKGVSAVADGTPIADVLELSDIIIEIDNKSLTNRPDLWGHYGIARELAALYNLKLKPYVSPNPVSRFQLETAKKNTIEVLNTTSCRRYIGIRINGVENKSSSIKIQSRLMRVGVRPINALVDITNYVMLDCGQPMHAFDATNVVEKIVVRNAKPKEKLLLLNGKEIELTTKDLVIADAEKPLALAGVIGGVHSGINQNTKEIILEIANFEPYTIRHSATRHGIRTDSSARNEKGIDAQRCELAQGLALSLIASNFKDSKVLNYLDVKNFSTKTTVVKVSYKWLTSRLGKEVGITEITKKMGILGFDVKYDENDTLTFSVPSWRSTGDVDLEEDILEEVARMHGFENFKTTSIKTSFTNAINQIDESLDRKIREYLAFRCGLNEIYTYPWCIDKYINALEIDTKDCYKLSEPPSPAESVVRNSLLPNICRVVEDNLRYFNNFGVFEAGNVFSNSVLINSYDKKELIPQKVRHIAGAFVGSCEDYANIFAKAKGVVEGLARNVQVKFLKLGQVGNKPTWAHNSVWSIITCGKNVIGSVGLLSSKAQVAAGIKNCACVLFEINMNMLEPNSTRENNYVKTSDYQQNTRDVSMVFNANVLWSEIETQIFTYPSLEAINLFKGVEFVEIYEGKQVGEGKKSVTFKLFIGSDERTVSGAEIDSCVESIVNRLKDNLKGELRA